MNESPKKQAYLLPYMIEMRRALHAIPELSGEEFETSAFIKARLIESGYTPRAAHTGLIVDIEGRQDRGTVAFRADFDALPISEKTGLSFASDNGNMHACGHDGHTAMLLGAAKHFAKYPPARNVRLIFQFGEEGEGGAETMIERGALDGVDEIYAFHLCPELEKGRIGTNRGTLFAGVVEHDVFFDGTSAHCASREEGADALAAAAEYVTRLRKRFEGRSGVLAHVGKIHGGSARNVVANDAKLECSLRYYDSDEREGFIDELRSIIDECDEKYGTKGRLVIKAIYPPLVNNPDCVDNVARITELTEMPGRFTAEDFAFYLRRVRGCMLWLGVRDEKHTSPLHSDTFDFDESAMLKGAEIFIELAEK